jgi:NAD(P)-dependent dehydrogenase (short-subunit alcohol dehydrogenase family)
VLAGASAKALQLPLGQTGATVYVTGRSTTGAESPDGGTIAKTAAAATEAGGHGVAVAVDHADDGAVAALFAQIAREHGRLDIPSTTPPSLSGQRLPVRSGKSP